MKLYTIGFTNTTAENFFERVAKNGVNKVIDTRLRPGGQLSGFAKAVDLQFFLSKIANIDYQVVSDLAPTNQMLKAYRAKQIDWAEYGKKYTDLLVERDVANTFGIKEFDGACLLCSEHDANFCHRRLAAEYLQSKWTSGAVEIIHL